MKPKLTDAQIISKRKCQKKGCSNKASAILNRKFLCKECNSRENPKRTYKSLNYIRSLLK